MGFTKTIAGFIFLIINNEYNNIDVMPDFIGYILIFRGLIQLARSN